MCAVLALRLEVAFAGAFGCALVLLSPSSAACAVAVAACLRQ